MKPAAARKIVEVSGLSEAQVRRRLGGSSP